MVSIKWPHLGSTTLTLQTGTLTVSVDECSDDKEGIDMGSAVTV